MYNNNKPNNTNNNSKSTNDNTNHTSDYDNDNNNNNKKRARATRRRANNLENDIVTATATAVNITATWTTTILKRKYSPSPMPNDMNVNLQQKLPSKQNGKNHKNMRDTLKLTTTTTEKNYTDFVLEFEFWVQDGLNSGVQFRSMSKPEYRDGRVHGYQYELDTSSRAWTAGIYDEANRGWLYPVEYHSPARSLFKNEQWNRARIECVGNEVQTFLNGRQVSHLVDDRAITGFIGLQVHSIRDASHAGYQVRWRNLRINTKSPKLSRSEEIYVRNVAPNTLSKTEKTRGWEFLFDGKKTAAWKGTSDVNPFNKDGWIVENGALTIQPGGKGGQIVTKKTYGAFELDFD